MTRLRAPPVCSQPSSDTSRQPRSGQIAPRRAVHGCRLETHSEYRTQGGNGGLRRLVDWLSASRLAFLGSSPPPPAPVLFPSRSRPSSPKPDSQRRTIRELCACQRLPPLSSNPHAAPRISTFLAHRGVQLASEAM
ncbi:hypothetical protein BS78_06G255600 [Paspalum vaginatum]|nr:hypothetical protein BS78_06G255600 [Paspalum vaginatum]